MTREELMEVINDRLGQKMFDEPSAVSVMLITNILGNLAKRGLIEAPYAITDMGSRVVAVAEEFGWEILDDEIQSFCEELCPPEQVDAFIYFIKSARDQKL